jgi:hypothetical protein
MKKVQLVLLSILSVFAITFGLCLVGQRASAQQTPNAPPTAASQEQPAPPQADQNAGTEAKQFTGKIVKSGDKLVLTDSASKTTYQLDDQQKARSFVNKNVKVTGVLDGTSDVIRVSTIERV